MDNLSRLGYTILFQEHANVTQLEIYEVARVVSVHKESVMISKGEGIVFAELAGKLNYTAEDLPLHML